MAPCGWRPNSVAFLLPSLKLAFFFREKQTYLQVFRALFAEFPPGKRRIFSPFARK